MREGNISHLLLNFVIKYNEFLTKSNTSEVIKSVDAEWITNPEM